MRFPLALLLLTLVACGSSNNGAAPCVGGQTIACPCAGGGMGTQTCQSDGRYSACVCPDAATVVDVVAPVDAPADRELPPPDRTPSGEDVAEAGGETGTAVDDVALVLDAGTPDDGPQGIDTGAEVDVPADRENPPDARTTVDVVVDRPCAEGTVECSGATTMRVCRGGAWTEVSCGRSTDDRQEVCTPSTNVCSIRPSVTGSCTSNNQCGYGYYGCVAGSCVWRGAVACVDDLGCRDVFGEFSNFRCVPVTIYGQTARACQEAAYPPRACVIDAQCLATYRCNVQSGFCVRR